MGIAFVFFAILLSVILAVWYRAKNRNENGLKNFTVNIALIILTGIISMFCLMAIDLIENNEIKPESAIYVGEFIIFILIFFNFCGYAFSIKNINKMHLTIICHVLFIVSTIIICCVIFLLVDLFYERIPELEFPLMMCFGLAIVTENIFSYLIAKKMKV